MTKTSEKTAAPAPTGDDFVRMYPCNHLNEQIRDPKQGLSAFAVLKETFFTEK